MLPGSYKNAGEQFSTKSLQLNYQLDLQDYSGSFNFNLDSIKLAWSFNTAGGGENDYLAEIASAVILQKPSKRQLQEIELRGSSRAVEGADSIDSSHEWKLAAYQIDNDAEKIYTDNHLKLAPKGQYAPALMLLSDTADDQQQVARTLTGLMAHGGQLSLPSRIAH